MMNKQLALFLFVAAAALTGCGGGGSSAPTMPGPAGPTPGATGNVPLSESVSGSMAWVGPSGHRTLYFLDVDTATGATCTGGCLGLWPVDAPSAGATGSGNMTLITRSDGTGQQWAYQGHPLYRYAGDSGADQANGDNIPDFGGHWHVARPNAGAAPGGGGGNPCTGFYC